MAADILVLNDGSSSLKVSFFVLDHPEPVLQLHAQVDGLNTPHPRASARDADHQTVFQRDWPLARAIMHKPCKSSSNNSPQSNLIGNRPPWVIASSVADPTITNPCESTTAFAANLATLPI